MPNTITDQIANEFRQLIEAAKELTSDDGPDLDELLTEGLTNPLDPETAAELLGRATEMIRARAAARGDRKTADALSEGAAQLIALAAAAKERVRMMMPATRSGMVKRQTIHLLEKHNGVGRGPVVPRPVFHETEVPMEGGFIRTRDIKLWRENERLEIHVQQYQARHGRQPSSEEMLGIMLGQMALEGATKGDEFEIRTLARSIAANGVRKPPIIDVDGTLLDGNRRVAACYSILADTSGEFTPDEKKRAEHIYVWQLLPHATDDDRTKVIVSLNFESDYKKEWPEYIKARKVYQDWEAWLNLENPRPSSKRQTEMKRELSKKYALGPDTSIVNRYLKMIKWTNEFEDHHINFKKRDLFEVKHKANHYFQYFDEIGKGENTQGGVAWWLTQDDKLKMIVFDLLFDGKIENWRQIRDIRHIAASEEAREALGKAHAELDVETAQDHVETAITIANTKRAGMRSIGANTRIESFAAWLDEVPPRTLRDEVKPDNLKALLRALKTVEAIAQQGLQRELPL